MFFGTSIFQEYPFTFFFLFLHRPTLNLLCTSLTPSSTAISLSPLPPNTLTFHGGACTKRFRFTILQRFLSQRFLHMALPWGSRNAPSLTIMDSNKNSRMDTWKNTQVRSVISNQYFADPHHPKTLVVVNQSVEYLASSFAPSYEEFEIEQVLDKPNYGSKYANPWLCEVAVLSWRTTLNVIRTSKLFLSSEIVLTAMALILSF